MADNRANLNDLINGILTGKLLEKFELYYADDCVMSENGDEAQTRVGKEANRAYETYFVNNATFHDARLGPVLVDGDHSAYEMYMDISMGGQRMQRTQVALQTWKDGKIAKEVFYYKG